MIGSATRRRAVFLDRDGTILVEKNYLSDPDEVELIPGAADALRHLRDAGYVLVVITNQSGIARGYFDEPEYRAVERRMEELLEAEGVALDGSEHCPHHPQFTGPCECRKPGLALFRKAAETLDIELAASAFIG
ncbi:MAG: HAD family hydrolase, partial [Gemmatimonadota bacterium]